MDARDIKSDLLALQRLYGLLKSFGDGMTNPASNMVDNRARLVLKYLLDSATQRAFKMYSGIFAGQAGVLQTPCASHLQQTDNAIKEQSSGLHTTREVDQSYRNDLGSDKEIKVGDLDFKLWNDQRFIRQRSQVESERQSTPNADVTGAEFRKKRCRVCQRSNVKQMFADDDTAKYSDRSTYPQHEVNNHIDYVPRNIEQATRSVLHYKTNESKNDKRRQTEPFVGNLGCVGSMGFSSDPVVPDITAVFNSNIEATRTHEEPDYISAEASEAIEHLESCISNLKIGSDHVQLFGEFSGQHENMDNNDLVYKVASQSSRSPLNYPSQVYTVSTEVNQPLAKVQPTNSMFCPSNGHLASGGRTYELRESNEEPKMPIHGQNMKTTMDKFESGNWRTSRNDIGPNVWNVAVAAQQETSPWPSTFLFAHKMESPHLTCSAMKDVRSGYEVRGPSKPANASGYPNYSEKLQSIDSNISSKWGTHVKRHSPNTTASLCSHQIERQHRNGFATSRNSMTASRTSLDPQELEDTASSLYSSNTKSQQASTYASVGEDYGSESGASPESRGTTRDYDSSRNQSEDGLYSSTSDDGTPEVISSSSGKSEAYSSSNQPMSRGSINQKKPSKTWKRLKDRLSIIFHQHHHHHHHHHGSHDDHRQGGHWKKTDINTLFKKHEGKIIRSKQGDEAYGVRAVEKMMKSQMHDKHRRGNFHGLVKAFVSHIWHSKKAKLEKGISARLAKGQRGRKKAKSGFWKMGKFPKKAHVKLGLGKKKTRIKALRS